MLEGTFADTTMMFKQTRPYPIHPQETSGVTLGSQAFYRYALKESDYPILTIIDPIRNQDGEFIPVGHYELALSVDRDFLILMETKNPVAIIPVFKVEEDKSAYKKPSKKEQKIKKKQEKERKKTNEKRAKVGMPPDEEKVNMEASIEYIKDGNYYLIKYERDAIRAWSAIKAD